MEIISLAKKSYWSQKSSAKRRGIEFNLTFEQWWDLWKPFYQNRGRGIEQFVMCRKLDQGAYELGNVTIGTVKSNMHTRKVVTQNKRYAEIQESWRGFVEDSREDDEDGWMPRHLKNPFRSSFT